MALPTLVTKDGVQGIQNGNEWVNSAYADPSLVAAANGPAAPSTTPTSAPTSSIPNQNSQPSMGASPIATSGASIDVGSPEFTSIMQQVNNNLSLNNNLTVEKQILLKHLYDTNLSPDELNKLSPSSKELVMGNNRDAVELQVRVLNDQIQGRANTLGQSIQAITTGYQQAQTNTKNAMNEILAYAESTGQPISSVAKALAPIYGINVTSEMMKNLEALGLAVKPLPGSVGPSGVTGAYGTATTTVSTALGVSPTTTLAGVISSNGMDSIVNAIIKNEGSSPKGVLNNPGNVKFTGLPGQIDSHVKASDGGTFASYATSEAGKQAIANIVQNAADGKSSAYGFAPTLGSFIDKYTNTAPNSSVSSAAPNDLTANTIDPATGLTQNAIFQDAIEYMYTGKTPSFGLGSSAKVVSARTAINNKAAAIAAAMGNTFPQLQALYKANASAAVQATQRLARVESVSTAATLNFPRLEALADQVRQAGVDITESDIQSSSASIQRKFGSGPAAAYIELVQTIRSDYASTQAALAGSTGGQFFAANAAEAIPIGLSSSQYEDIKNTILLSSQNASTAINGEVTKLIGVSGTAGGGNTTTSSGADDYAAYLKSIGQ